MTVRLEHRPVYLGVGLTCMTWVVLDGNEAVAWDTDYDAAHHKAHNWMEQKVHRDGV